MVDEDLETTADAVLSEVPAAPEIKAPPIQDRFLFVDVAAMRAKQLRRGARPRLGDYHEAEREVPMKPRVTVSRTSDGELEIWMNREGRDKFVAELQRLGEHSDHFHLGPDEDTAEFLLSTVAYRPTDEVISYAKVLFRPDEWDRKYFPHVLGEPS